MWQCLLSLELPQESHVLTDWQNIIGDLVKDRIDCVVSLSLYEHVPPYLSIEVLFNRALLPIHQNVSHIQ